MPQCWFCGTALSYAHHANVPRGEACPGCGKDLRCCRNCRHHDPGAHNQCREPDTEWVTDRERANFCERFQLAAEPVARAAPGRGGDARSKLDGLFRKDA